MDKSLGNKRKLIPDGENTTKDYITAITKIYDDFIANKVVTVSNDAGTYTQIVSKICDNNDFGYNKITVERPLRLNFCVNLERIERLKDNASFKNIAGSKKKDAAQRLIDEEVGIARQNAIIDFLMKLGKSKNEKFYNDRKVFLLDLKKLEKKKELKLNAAELKSILDSLGEKDESAEICINAKGEKEVDTELRDTENVPLKRDIDEYFKSEVKPHVPDAWVDYSKTKVGYEIPITRHFYVYTPSRPLHEIDSEIMNIEKELLDLLNTRGDGNEV